MSEAVAMIGRGSASSGQFRARSASSSVSVGTRASLRASTLSQFGSVPDRLQIGSRVTLAGGSLLSPVTAELTHDSPMVLVATEPKTGIFGCGASPSAAINDLRAALIEYRDTLAETPGLTGQLLKTYRFLQLHVAKG